MKSLSNMTEEEIERFISSLRVRRSEAEEKLKAHKRAHAVAKSASLKERLVRQIELAQKDLDMINKKLEKLEQRINSIAALRLQHGDLALDDLANVSVSRADRGEDEDEVE